jgi:hypothetical protein
LGGPKFVGFYSVKEHLGVADEHGSAEIELFLPDKSRGRWNAGLAVIDEGGKLRLGDFVLAAVT